MTLEKYKLSMCIPKRPNRSHMAIHNTRLYKQRHKIENMFGRLKDWGRNVVRYAHTFFSAT